MGESGLHIYKYSIHLSSAFGHAGHEDWAEHNPVMLTTHTMLQSLDVVYGAPQPQGQLGIYPGLLFVVVAFIWSSCFASSYYENDACAQSTSC